MNTHRTLSEEFSVISSTAVLIAISLYIIQALVLLGVLTLASDSPTWPLFLKAGLSLIAPFPLSVWVLVIGYVYGDARRRQMRHVVWTLLAIFIPYLIGVLLYFLLRDPMPVCCPRCGAAARAGFAHCPRCGAQLPGVCPACGKRLEGGWSHCAHCGAKL